jgi:hypothetical protein
VAVRVRAIRWASRIGGEPLAIIVNGKDMKDAVIKTDQFEMRVLDLTPDVLKITVKELNGQAFNFVPRFIAIVYPERTINARDAGPVVIPAKETKELMIQFREKLRMEKFMPFELRYAGKRLATISVE